MRPRIIKSAEKIVTVSEGNATFLITKGNNTSKRKTIYDLFKGCTMIVCAAFFVSCGANIDKAHTEEHNTSLSWACYCERYNVNEEYPTQKQVDFYLDCYVGSVEEEQDMNF